MAEHRAERLTLRLSTAPPIHFAEQRPVTALGLVQRHRPQTTTISVQRRAELLTLAVLEFQRPTTFKFKFLIPKNSEAWLEYLLEMVKKRVNVEYLPNKEIIETIGRWRSGLKNPNQEVAKSLQDPDLPQCYAWSKTEVADWISDLGYPQYKEAFVNNNISGKKLINVDANGLNRIGIQYFEHIKDIATKIRDLLKIHQPNILRALLRIVPYQKYLEYRSKTGPTYNNTTFKKFCTKHDFPYEILLKNKCALIACICQVLIQKVGTKFEHTASGLSSASSSSGSEISLHVAPTVEFTVRHQVIRDKIVQDILDTLVKAVFEAADRKEMYRESLVETIRDLIRWGYQQLYTNDQIIKKLQFARVIADEVLKETQRTATILQDINQFQRHIRSIRGTKELSVTEVEQVKHAAETFVEEVASIATMLAIGDLELETIFAQQPEFNQFVNEICTAAERKTNELVPVVDDLLDDIVAEAKMKVLMMQIPYLSEEELKEAKEFADELLDEMLANTIEFVEYLEKQVAEAELAEAGDIKAGVGKEDDRQTELEEIEEEDEDEYIGEEYEGYSYTKTSKPTSWSSETTRRYDQLSLSGSSDRDERRLSKAEKIKRLTTAEKYKEWKNSKTGSTTTEAESSAGEAIAWERVAPWYVTSEYSSDTYEENESEYEGSTEEEEFQAGSEEATTAMKTRRKTNEKSRYKFLKDVAPTLSVSGEDESSSTTSTTNTTGMGTTPYSAIRTTATTNTTTITTEEETEYETAGPEFKTAEELNREFSEILRQAARRSFEQREIATDKLTKAVEEYGTRAPEVFEGTSTGFLVGDESASGELSDSEDESSSNTTNTSKSRRHRGKGKSKHRRHHRKHGEGTADTAPSSEDLLQLRRPKFARDQPESRTRKDTLTRRFMGQERTEIAERWAHQNLVQARRISDNQDRSGLIHYMADHVVGDVIQMAMARLLLKSEENSSGQDSVRILSALNEFQNKEYDESMTEIRLGTARVQEEPEEVKRPGSRIRIRREQKPPVQPQFLPGARKSNQEGLLACRKHPSPPHADQCAADVVCFYPYFQPWKKF